MLLDAFGTLVTLDAPAPLLRALLAERLGVQVTEAQAADALAAEVDYYRGHMHEGVDVDRVAAAARAFRGGAAPSAAGRPADCRCRSWR